MGLFGGLFDKKTCDICGNKIGLLGNRKLEDGNLCKDCAAKLSPWFSERRHSTLAEIQNQLVYREQNKLAVSAFNVTRSLGKNSWKILLDEDARKFLVTNSSKWQEENPDVLDFSQLTGCDLEIKENRSELKQKDSEGKQVSYNPPRYEYSYNFYVTEGKPLSYHAPGDPELQAEGGLMRVAVRTTFTPGPITVRVMREDPKGLPSVAW